MSRQSPAASIPGSAAACRRPRRPVALLLLLLLSVLLVGGWLLALGLLLVPVTGTGSSQQEAGLLLHRGE